MCCLQKLFLGHSKIIIMKRILTLLLTVLVCACNNHPASNKPSDTTSSLTPLTATKDPVVFVGVFARWTDNTGAQYDGDYDSTLSIFCSCQTNRAQSVPASQITYQQYGSCDNTNQPRIAMFRYKKDGSLDSEGIKVNVSGNKAMVSEAGKPKEIELPAATLDRIRNAHQIYIKRSSPH